MKRIFPITIISITLFAIISFSYFNANQCQFIDKSFKPAQKNNNPQKSVAENKEFENATDSKEPQLKSKENDKYISKNILILGIDSRGGEPARADTIILLNIREDKINFISIPRDSRIPIKKSYGKINSTYAEGGIESCKKAVETLLDTKINNYIVFNFNAIEKGVDSLGGFTVTIPKDIKISDPELKKRFLLKKGKHKLNGIQTLEYLRYRRDGRGDIGRIYRQQEFIKDLQQSFLRLDNIPLIPRAYVAVHDDIKTDMSSSDIASYFIYGYKLKDKFEYHSLEGYSKMIKKISYYILNEKSVENIKTLLK